MDRPTEVIRFYDILEELERRLGGMRRLADCRGRMQWPLRGVYFFFETGEPRSTTGAGSRVVRVGTHGLKLNSRSKLWTRLSQHRGNPKGGNHRGSIFRLLVGEALRSNMKQIEPKSWGVCSDPGKAAAKLGCSRSDIVERERELEILVSRYIGQIPFLWLAINDPPGPESLRGYVERNAIALLSNYNRESVDSPSQSWLGRFSSRERVVRSGLCNSKHVDERYDPGFLNQFEKLVLAVPMENFPSVNRKRVPTGLES